MEDFYHSELYSQIMKPRRHDFVKTQDENVNHPAHYVGEIECIDAMVQQFGIEATKNFCLLNSFKYLWRAPKKHETPQQDIEKSLWYLTKWQELQNL